MCLKTFILVFLLFNVCVARLSEFRFNGTFICDSPPATPICITLTYWEEDEWTVNDVIGRTPVSCSMDPIRRIETTGFQDGDGPFDRRYEVYLDIFHNCNKRGLYRKMYSYISDPTTDSDLIAISFNVTLE